VIDAAGCLRHPKALISLDSQVAHVHIVCEEAQDDSGLLHYRLSLRDVSLVEMFQRFHLEF